MLKKVTMLLALVAMLSSCAIVLPPVGTTANSHPTGRAEFNCQVPDGRSYECYKDEECYDYFEGYNWALRDRFDMLEKHGALDKPVQVIYINLWADHKELLFLGKMTGERKMGGKIWFRMWLEVYNLDCELLDKSYKEGYLKPKKKETPFHDQNNFKLEASRS